jgi:hypothetical protein
MGKLSFGGLGIAVFIAQLSAAVSVDLAAQAPPVGLGSVKRIYVDKMDNDLDQYIRAELQKQFKGTVQVVLKPELADAIMAGVSEHQSGTRAAVTGRWMGLHDTATGSVSLLDKTGEVVLWSGEAGDRSVLFGAMKRGGPRKVADRLVNNLKKAMESQ